MLCCETNPDLNPDRPYGDYMKSIITVNDDFLQQYPTFGAESISALLMESVIWADMESAPDILIFNDFQILNYTNTLNQLPPLNISVV